MDDVGEEPNSSAKDRTGFDWEDKKHSWTKNELVQARSKITLCYNVIVFVYVIDS